MAGRNFDGLYTRVFRSKWTDHDFVTSLSMPAQWTYDALLTGPGRTLAGVTPYKPGGLVQRCRTATREVIDSAIVELEETCYIAVDRDTDEVLIRSFMRRDGMMTGPLSARGAARAWADILSLRLRSIAAHEVQRLQREQPELAGWKDREVQAILEHPGIDMRVEREQRAENLATVHTLHRAVENL